MKMFKRLAAFGAAAILALSMGITAFAEGSPSTSGVVASTVVSATDANGNSVKVTVGAQSEVKNEEARKILNTTPHKWIKNIEKCLCDKPSKNDSDKIKTFHNNTFIGCTFFRSLIHLT